MSRTTSLLNELPVMRLLAWDRYGQMLSNALSAYPMVPVSMLLPFINFYNLHCLLNCEGWTHVHHTVPQPPGTLQIWDVILFIEHPKEGYWFITKAPELKQIRSDFLMLQHVTSRYHQYYRRAPAGDRSKVERDLDEMVRSAYAIFTSAYWLNH